LPTPPNSVSDAAARPPGWLLILIGWFIPGAGFALAGRRARGTVQCLLVFATFALGLAFHSGVAWPSWSWTAPDFNLINNLTFIIQMGAGLPALASLAAQPVVLGALDFHHAGALAWLTGVPQHAYYELGSYYMIVAGAINYFAVCNVYDRLVRKQKRFVVQEDGSEEEPAPEEATPPS